MSRAYATPLRLDIKPHAARQYFFLLIAAISMAAVWLANIVMGLKMLLWLLVILAGWRSYRHNRLACSLIWQQHNHWILVMDNEPLEARLLPGSFNSPFLMVLNFALLTGGRKTVLLLPAEVEGEAYRRLRVRFRVEAGKLFRKGS